MTSPQVFSCKIYQVFKNTFLHRTPPVAVSEFYCGEKQIYIHTIFVLNVLRLGFMRIFKSGWQTENNRLSKHNSLTMKVAEDRSRKRNNSTEDKESLVQSIIVDTWYITDNRLQWRKKKKEEKKREEKKHNEIIVDHFNIGKCSYTDVTQGTIEPKPVIELSAIYLQLIEQERSNSPYIENTPPILCTTSANLLNHSSSSEETKSESREIFSAQDKEFLSMLVDLPTSVDISRTMEISS